MVLRQFGHLLGLINEHQNPNAGIPWDREKVYRYYRATNGWSRETVDRQLLTPASGKYRQFDRDSIMMYPIPNELTRGDFETTWNSSLSASDKGVHRPALPAFPQPHLIGSQVRLERRDPLLVQGVEALARTHLRRHRPVDPRRRQAGGEGEDDLGRVRYQRDDAYRSD